MKAHLVDEFTFLFTKFWTNCKRLGTGLSSFEASLKTNSGLNIVVDTLFLYVGNPSNRALSITDSVTQKKLILISDGASKCIWTVTKKEVKNALIIIYKFIAYY